MEYYQGQGHWVEYLIVTVLVTAQLLDRSGHKLTVINVLVYLVDELEDISIL
jgi:hypothetical protein